MVTDYLKQRRENSALALQLAETSQALAAIPLPPADLEGRLSAAQNAFLAARNAFPPPSDTTGIINDILRLAEETEVKAIPIITQPWMVENVSDHDYAVFRLSVTATGTYTRVVEFIQRVETGEPPTLVIGVLLAERAAETVEPGVAPEFGARLDLVVYARPPAADE